MGQNRPKFCVLCGKNSPAWKKYATAGSGGSVLYLLWPKFHQFPLPCIWPLFVFCFDGCVGNSIHFKVVYLLFVVSVGNIYSTFSLWQFILYSDLAVETLTPKHININICINRTHQNVNAWKMHLSNLAFLSSWEQMLPPPANFF